MFHLRISTCTCGAVLSICKTLRNCWFNHLCAKWNQTITKCKQAHSSPTTLTFQTCYLVHILLTNLCLLQHCILLTFSSFLSSYVQVHGFAYPGNTISSKYFQNIIITIIMFLFDSQMIPLNTPWYSPRLRHMDLL